MIRPFWLWGAPLIIVAASVIGIALSAGPSQTQTELALIGQPREAAVTLLGGPDATAQSQADLRSPAADAFTHSTRPIGREVLLYEREDDLLHVYVDPDGTIATVFYGERVGGDE